MFIYNKVPKCGDTLSLGPCVLMYEGYVLSFSSRIITSVLYSINIVLIHVRKA